MIRIEPDTLGPVLFTNEQFFAAHDIIARNHRAHYDIVEERFKQDSITYARLMLWSWPETREGTPTRTWILPDGTIALVEDADWIGEDEWPAWVEPTRKETPSS